MKKPYKFAFLFAFLLAAALGGACGGDDNGLDDIQPTPDGDITLPTPDAAPCDIATQNCESGQKCTIALNDMLEWQPTVCRNAGTVALGEPCTRESSTPSGAGRDNCVVGAYCTAFGAPDAKDTPKYCRQFCRSSAGCPTQGQQCFPFPNYSQSPVEGVCITSCTVFDNVGCTSGTWCAPTMDADMALMGTCDVPGTAAVKAPCGDVNMDGMAQDNESCVAGSACFGTSTTASSCLKFCDLAGTKVACDANEECTQNMTMGLPPSVGLCLPKAMMKSGLPAFRKVSKPL